ncbi:DUF3099 domain-containing protein [Streptomyces sp. QL37]|uniref:DUF3099 domain-containing protein n=1 Tax=Streptomyces sp. QL37 TaxID=2093747 RepID=UPI0021CB8FD9|nr:DUF3099 domain-containing protein [Streptomyces sp. QL37]
MYARRRRVYFLMMGGCLFLFVSAWAFVRLWSVPAAVAMCVVAMVIPPVAAIVANRRGPEDRWWDDPSRASRPPDRRTRDEPPRSPRQQRTGDRVSDEWWDELDGRDHRR